MRNWIEFKKGELEKINCLTSQKLIKLSTKTHLFTKFYKLLH